MNRRNLFILLALFLTMPIVAYAAGLVPCDGIDQVTGAPDCQLCYFVDLMQNILKWLVTILSIVMSIIIMVSGFRLVVSTGNASEMQAAKSMITNAFIGFVIVLSAWLLMDYIMKAFLPGGNTSIGPWNKIQCVGQPQAVMKGSLGLINGGTLTQTCTPATPPATGFDCTSQIAACTAGNGTPTVVNNGQEVSCNYPASAYGGSCNQITDTSNPCHESNANMQAAFGSRATEAAIICNKESGGAPINSGSDLCCGPSGNCSGAPSFSGGYFQINVLSEANKIPGCTPGAFYNKNGSTAQGNCVRRNNAGICTGWSCQITDMTMYNKCMEATKDPALNFQVAQTLFKSRGFQPWANSAKKCSVPYK